MDLLWGKNLHVFIYQTTITYNQGYVAHLYLTLRLRGGKTLPHQSQSRNIILNVATSKAMKNIDDNFPLTDTLIIVMSYKYFT